MLTLIHSAQIYYTKIKIGCKYLFLNILPILQPSKDTFSLGLPPLRVTLYNAIFPLEKSGIKLI